MKKCLNCKAINHSDDIYCRNCGFLLQSSKNYILISVMIIFIIIGIIFMIALFVASYMLTN